MDEKYLWTNKTNAKLSESLVKLNEHQNMYSYIHDSAKSRPILYVL